MYKLSWEDPDRQTEITKNKTWKKWWDGESHEKVKNSLYVQNLKRSEEFCKNELIYLKIWHLVDWKTCVTEDIVAYTYLSRNWTMLG